VGRKYRDDYPRVKITASAIKKQMLETETTLYAVSPTLFPRPDYWPPQAKVVGYFERNKALNWKPDESLTNFLAKYEKVVFISFGSMTTRAIRESHRSRWSRMRAAGSGVISAP